MKLLKFFLLAINLFSTEIYANNVMGNVAFIQGQQSSLKIIEIEKKVDSLQQELIEIKVYIKKIDENLNNMKNNEKQVEIK